MNMHNCEGINANMNNYKCDECMISIGNANEMKTFKINYDKRDEMNWDKCK